MAVITDWQKPLEEALESVLKKPSLSIKEIEEVRQTLATMEGSEGVQNLQTLLGEVIRQREKEYREAVDKVKNGTSARVVAEGVDILRSKEFYEEKETVIRFGEERIKLFLQREQAVRERLDRQRRKRRRTMITAAVCCMAAGVAFSAAWVVQKRLQVESLKDQVQAMIDAGNEDDIAEPLKELIDRNVDRSALTEYSETALEGLAQREGFADAFALLERLEMDVEEAVDPDLFFEWSEDRLASGKLSPGDGWIVARESLQSGHRKSSEDIVISAFDDYLDFIAEEAGQGKDVTALIEESQEYLTCLPVDPDTALRLCYRLGESGRELKDLFPGGIAVSIPVGASVSAMNEYILSDNGGFSAPDLSGILPVMIIESENSHDGEKMFMTAYASESELEESIKGLQSQDSHYIVLLLPEYLMAVPDSRRPAAYEDVTCLAAIQQSYLFYGGTYITTVTTRGSVEINSSDHSFRGYFASFDGLIVYDLKEPDHFLYLEGDSDEPAIGDEEWLKSHKERIKRELSQYESEKLLSDNSEEYADLEWYTSENVLGEHNIGQFEADFADAIEHLSDYLLFSLLMDDYDSSEESQ